MPVDESMLHCLSRLRLRRAPSGMLMHFMPTVKNPSTDLLEVLKAIYVFDKSRFSIVIAFLSRNSDGDESASGLNFLRTLRVTVSP